MRLAAIDQLELALEKIKKRKRKVEINPQEMDEKTKAFLERMDKAYDADMQALKQKKPAIARLALLQDVGHMLGK
jgi:hypothetical protein